MGIVDGGLLGTVEGWLEGCADMVGSNDGCVDKVGCRDACVESVGCENGLEEVDGANEGTGDGHPFPINIDVSSVVKFPPLMMRTES